MSSQNNQNNNDWIGWVAIVVLFCIPYTWPVALFLLIRKLTGADKKKSQPRHPYDIQRQQEQQRQQSAAQQEYDARNAARQERAQQQYAAQQGRTQQSAAQNAARSTGAPPKSAASTKKAAAKSAQPKLPRGKGLTLAGAIVTGIFGLGFVTELAQAVSWGGLGSMITELVSLLAFLCLGLVLLFCGLSRTRKGKRYHKYLNLIGKRSSVSLEALAKTTGASRRRVLDDLQDMLDDGLLPTGYLDLAHDRLVLSEEGIPDEEPEQKAQAAPETAPAQDDNAILAEIRAVNDAIPDPVMSAKIDRIGEITGKILDYQRRNPGKDSQLRSFLNYYLPTTLKILRAYAQLDAQGVEGENISAAKGRIEGMMDKVVEGFENQLDKLFRDSALDISSDVAVLEQMLEKDGLSNHNQGMTLGG